MSGIFPSDEVSRHAEEVGGVPDVGAADIEAPATIYLEHLTRDVYSAVDEALGWPEPHRKVLAACFIAQARRLGADV